MVRLRLRPWGSASLGRFHHSPATRGLAVSIGNLTHSLQVSGIKTASETVQATFKLGHEESL